jgi:hypothetical protein
MKETAIDRAKRVFHEISKKPIFVCSSQTVKMYGHTYKNVPHCDYVQISFEDYNKLYAVITKLKG